MRFATVPLGEVCAQDRASVRARERSELPYLGMESIESQSGSLAKGELSKTPEAPEANSFLFTQSHVLYGKLRPYLNKVHVPAFDGKCSTELVPLRPSKELQREYLAYFLRAPSTVERISQRVAGARMPRADMSFVMSLPIPLPPGDEQRRIVDLLSRAENIVGMRREAEAKAKEIIPELFLNMFGDPAGNPKGWEVRSLPEVLAEPFKNGLYLAKEYYVADGAPDGVEMVHMSDAFYGEVQRGQLRRVIAPAKALEPYLLTGRDLLVARRSLNWEGAAKLCRLPESTEPIVFESSFIRLRTDPERIETDYLYYYMNSPQTRAAFIEGRITGITISGINQAALATIPVMVPDLESQRRFCMHVNQSRSISASQIAALQTSTKVFKSLLAGVFGGGT